MEVAENLESHSLPVAQAESRAAGRKALNAKARGQQLRRGNWALLGTFGHLLATSANLLGSAM